MYIFIILYFNRQKILEGGYSQEEKPLSKSAYTMANAPHQTRKTQPNYSPLICITLPPISFAVKFTTPL